MTPIEEYIDFAKNIQGFSENTVKAYQRDLQQFAEWLLENKAEPRWSSVEQEDIDEYIKCRSKQGLSASSTNRILSSISGFYRYQIRMKRTDINPARYESRKKQPERVPNTIPMEDLKKCYKNCKGISKLMIGILATTGIRIQELLDIKWEDIRWQDSAIKIHGKGNKERLVYTSSEILEPLLQQSAYARASNRILYISQRESRGILYHALRPFTKAKQVSPHAIRHTYATTLAQQGVPVTTIAKLLGHESIETTQKYINLTEIEAASKCLVTF